MVLNLGPKYTLVNSNNNPSLINPCMITSRVTFHKEHIFYSSPVCIFIIITFLLSCSERSRALSLKATAVSLFHRFLFLFNVF